LPFATRPDHRGRRRVVNRGRIERRFANGRTECRRIALLHNTLNKPSATSGLVLGTKIYYFDD
jgi:hypothetical protein